MATREPELYKDKIEVSLDGRQIFYLFFGGAVLVGVVFVLGVMVGRRVESRSHVDRLDHASHRGASDPLAALDGLESKKLSFQDSLTKTDVKTAVEHQIDDLAKARPADDKKPVEVKAAAKAAPPIAEDEKKPEKVEKGEKKKEPKSAEPVTKPDQAKPEKPKTDKSETKPDKSEQAKVEPKPEKKKKPVLEERINGDVITAAEVKPEDKPKLPEKGKFTLQLSSFQDKQEAEAFLGSVKAAGYQAYVTEAEVSGKGTFYRVRLGTYRSLDAANDAKADVEKAIKKSASVMRL
jgi:DedD protein